ncbi:MAG: preprotein translocase subunit SecE [Candidatus Saccharimonadales bacterium]
MAKSPKLNVKNLLGRRVELPLGKKINKDVKAPKWLRAIGSYFKGSYTELRQVKWPTRRASWSLTIAVIIFTAALVGVILALDYGFDLLFKQVLL